MPLWQPLWFGQHPSAPAQPQDCIFNPCLGCCIFNPWRAAALGSSLVSPIGARLGGSRWQGLVPGSDVGMGLSPGGGHRRGKPTTPAGLCSQSQGLWPSANTTHWKRGCLVPELLLGIGKVLR